jgi:hypothetical protein
MQIKYVPLLFSIATGLGGCTTAAWYEGMKTGAENECRQQQPGDAQDCLSRVNKKPYEDYEKERSAK